MSEPDATEAVRQARDEIVREYGAAACEQDPEWFEEYAAQLAEEKLAQVGGA